MKLHAIAIAAATLAATSVSFAAPAVDVNAASTVKIYMSGATALRNTIAGIVLNDICGTTANTTTTLYNMASGSSFSFNGNFWAITCKVTDATAAGKIGVPVNTNIAFFKSDAGGSAQGVFPIYFGTQRPFVEPSNLANCVGATNFPTVADRSYSGCPSTRLAVPMFGISDVEPKLFAGPNVPNDILDTSDDAYPAGGLTDSQVTTELTVTPVVQTLFAVAVNNALYNDMFAKQGLASKFASAEVLPSTNPKTYVSVACTTASTDANCIPSIGQAEARGIFAGTETNWRQLTDNAALVDSQLNVCRRVNGSGTQAAANLQFGGFPCNGSSLSPADFAFSSNPVAEPMSSAQSKTASGLSVAQYLTAAMGAGPATMPQGQTFYFEGPGTGDVISCLNAAQTAGGYAIGHVSKENVPNTSGVIGQWKHVKLEGALPDGAQAKQGRYDYVVESTVQYKGTTYDSLTPSQKAFITGFTTEIAKPAALAKLPTAAQAGVLALPESYAGAFGVGTANEIKFGSRVTRGGNSCAPLTAVK